MSYLGLDDPDLQDALLGEHVLEGVDFETEGIGNGIRFILDGETYLVVEDENDDYRSSAKAIEVSPDNPVVNTFDPVRVIGFARDDDEILALVDPVTGKDIIEVGTENADDYYPMFICRFSPENMSINQKES